MKKLLQNERGVALMMILSAIVILTALYSQFTFDSKISRIKATNILDRSQAKLLAESGLQLAMARLRLYKEAYNKVESNQSIKSMVKPQLLNQLWEVPFVYPIPLDKNVSQLLKQTVDKFQDESLLDGQMKVTIQNISSRINLNLLRIDVTKLKTDAEGNLEPPKSSSLFDTGRDDEVVLDQQLYQLLKRLVDERKETDEAFADRNGNLNYQNLFTNLKYYTSDFQTMNSDPFFGEAEANFQRIPLTPKYGPLSSFSELYAIPGWTDELIELVKNEFSVYPSMQIDLNKITLNMLKLLFPSLTEEQIKPFFAYRDDPNDPKEINSVADLKKFFVEDRQTGPGLDPTEFDQRIEGFQKSGITFGSSPNLFKVISVGEFNRAIYTLVAYVSLPPMEQAQQGGSTNGGASGGGTNGGGTTATGSSSDGTSGGGTAGAQSKQLLEPRIIEIQIN